MADDVKRKPGRPRKGRKELVETPKAFLADEEAGITDMQAAFVWHYTEGACGQTEAARRAGFSFPASAATKTAVRIPPIRMRSPPSHSFGE